jgi:hypothetical protein
MTLKLMLIAAGQGGVILRQQAIDVGYSDDEIAHLLRSRTWHAIRRGAYIVREVWEGLDDAGKHRATAHAVALKLTGDPVISHVSSLVMHNLPVWGHDLSSVHVTRPTKSSRTEANVIHHRGELPDDQVVTVDGVRVTSPTRAVVETAFVSPVEPCITSADAALHRKLTTHPDLKSTLDAMRDWAGARAGGRVVASADGGSESVGESRARIAFDAAGLPTPELQAEILDARGMLVGRVDFLFREQHTIVEFDGKIKYSEELAPDGDPAQALWQEKKREDRLRSLGYEVVRITWADLEDIDALAAKIRAAFARAKKRNARALVA